MTPLIGVMSTQKEPSLLCIWLKLALAMSLYEGMLQPNQLMRVNIWEIVEGWKEWKMRNINAPCPL